MKTNGIGAISTECKIMYMLCFNCIFGWSAYYPIFLENIFKNKRWIGLLGIYSEGKAYLVKRNLFEMEYNQDWCNVVSLLPHCCHKF